jgi:ribosomal protein S18 acetylase RimI-like enzyme
MLSGKEGRGKLRTSGDGQTVTIRLLKIDDYHKIMEVWERSGLPYKPKGRDSKPSIERQMEENPDLFLGAEIEGELVGVIIASSEGGRKGWLNRIAVIPEKRGAGIAKELTLRAEEALRKRGIKIIALLIHKENENSIHLAKSLGYIPAPDILYLTKRESDDV